MAPRSIRPPSRGARPGTRIWSPDGRDDRPRHGRARRAPGTLPVLDVVRDYRWGRVEETLGEDPYLVALAGHRLRAGLQSAGVIATLKHFAGYSASRAARNHGPVSMGPRELRDVILPSFEMAIALGGARVGDELLLRRRRRPGRGQPLAAHRGAARGVGFRGHGGLRLLGGPVPGLHAPGGAGPRRGRCAGPRGRHRRRAARHARVRRRTGRARPLGRPRRGARRPGCPPGTPAKAQVGLLDAEWTPEASVAHAAEIDLDSPANRDLAREVAERSVVLLDAGTALPIRSPQRPMVQKVAVVGPCADDARTFMGCYAFPTHVLPRHPRAGLGIEVPTGPGRIAGRAG